MAHDNNSTPTSQIWQVITASSVGTVIEWYDFYIFGSLAAIIGPVLFGTSGDFTKSLLGALAIFGVGFVVRPFGALFFGRIGDMIGRKYTFLVTLLIMGGATFVTGLVPSYDKIGWLAPAIVLVLRIFQGLALGGEYGGGRHLRGRIRARQQARLLHELHPELRPPAASSSAFW